jgi:glyoxylase-like metal-dependent hydrolase (beta-lactamase superfamily II)
VITSADPAYVHQLDESLHQIGRTRNDVRALALTHGHIDHTGMAEAAIASAMRIGCR